MKIITTFIAGAGAGIIAGYLTAPKSGKETREDILSEIESTKDQVEKKAMSKLKEAKDILNETVEKQTKNGKHALDKVKEVVTVS